LFIGRGLIVVNANRYTDLRTAVTGAAFLSARETKIRRQKTTRKAIGAVGAMKSLLRQYTFLVHFLAPTRPPLFAIS
jgi:hypothetical protein